MKALWENHPCYFKVKKEENLVLLHNLKGYKDCFYMNVSSSFGISFLDIYKVDVSLYIGRCYTPFQSTYLKCCKYHSKILSVPFY